MTDIMNADRVIIGLTGPFGSGCSTLRKALEKFRQFQGFKLSEEVRSEAKNRGMEPTKHNLQDIGNDLRLKYGNNYLAVKTIEKMETTQSTRCAIHGFRHPAEVQEFRKYFNFFLVAVDASTQIRWDRVKESYRGNQKLFDDDDKRDRDEGLSYGQQVLRCVEQADVIFLNEEQYPTAAAREEKIKSRFDQYLTLMTGEEKPRQPAPDETMMTLASSLSIQSSCIKRRVGAVLCNERGFIVSAAYNEVPGNEEDCLGTYRECYRDYYRDDFKKQIFTKFDHCPSCGKKLETVNESPFICRGCNKNLVDYFPSDFKVLDKCRAIHAEETVLLQTPSSESKNGVLYITTFPCMQCAKRIIHAMIGRVMYIDPYPDSESVDIFKKGGINAKKFEGIKAQVFYKLYSRRRELIEKEVEKLKKTSKN